jgi:hypothetical protein
MRLLTPNLACLPAAQREVWPSLAAVPRRFVLYGGTALALRLGHRQSADFDFFSSDPFSPGSLFEEIPWLQQAEPLQSSPDTLSVLTQREGGVRVAFFGGLHLGRVGEPQPTTDGVLLVASLLDLAGTKAAVVQQRAEKKDYLDLAALLQGGVSLEQAMGAAQALYRDQFNPMITLKALAYFGDGDLPELPRGTQESLRAAAARFTRPEPIERVSDRIAP